MSLVRIANFMDLTEAQVVASALRSADIPVMLQNEVWGQMNWTMQQAVGGFPVWVPEEDVEAARAIIASGRTVNPEVLDWRAQPGALAQAPAAIGGALLGDWTYAVARKRPSRVSWTVFLLYAALVLFAIGGTWLLTTLGEP